jgi:hypothetical protein
MKSEILQQNEISEPVFPSLYIFRGDVGRSVATIVLMRTRFSGTIVSLASHLNLNIGDSIEAITDFNFNDFVTFTGQVTLRN